jgi:hypothetical protein
MLIRRALQQRHGKWLQAAEVNETRTVDSKDKEAVRDSRADENRWRN